MQNLTSQYNPALTPTSQEPGNMIQPDLPKAAMTGPGSVPVSPLTPPVTGSDPRINPTENVPVSSAPHKPHPQTAGNLGYGKWSDTPNGAQWKTLP